MSFVPLESFKHMRAPQICCTSYLNWLERSCHLWASTFLFKSAPYPLMYAYFPPFVYLHCIHDLCISHSLPSKLQILCYANDLPRYANIVQISLATQTLCGIIRYAKPVALFLLRIPCSPLSLCKKPFLSPFFMLAYPLNSSPLIQQRSVSLIQAKP
jgi:hypothetical protein